MHSKELLKGTLQTIILKLLADQGKMYGYEITQRVKELSGGEMLLTEGALYPTLHKLEAEKLLTTEKVTMGKRVRKYYKLTEAGQSSAAEKMDEFTNFIQMMHRVLQIDPAF
ncbi:Transcriptional regulator, PadR family [Fulvivirga imtechensis AK7]|uniref:Transcriptional regulator, PadR family n=1 Tax=Fulvivirga imtechensis AK7 TaxID=1237149 RepID=L8JLK8_9BACT|nr:PadR family transcriptional regulator [Fulvivirga imtechensis]ELR69806.1 Transcriptional regulator, PadR family [Fulvivirga imtechensis AK7]